MQQDRESSSGGGGRWQFPWQRKEGQYLLWGAFVLISVSVFLAEFLIMVLFAALDLPSHWLVTYFLDALLLTMMLGPILYLLYYRPTRRVIAVQQELLERLRLSAIVFDQAADGLMVTGSDATIQTINQAFTRITGYRLDEVLGKNPRILKSGRHSARFYTEMWQRVAEAGHWSGEVWNRCKSGRIYPEFLSITAIRDEENRITNYAAIFSQAFHDRLTGLPNRHLFLETLEQAILDAGRNAEQLAVVFVDLDGFKAVNDRFGHTAGDQLLQAVAGVLRRSIRKNDVPARLGGDEFLILLRGIHSADDVHAIVAKLLERFPVEVPGLPEARVTASIGVSVFPGDGTEADLLLRRADTAMYRAKANGKNAAVQHTEPPVALG